MTTDEQHYRREVRMQKFRILTPLTSAASALSSIGVLACILWFGNYYMTQQEKKDDVLFSKVADLQKGQACTNMRVASCCGEKANVNC